jgi:hypothetical protein
VTCSLGSTSSGVQLFESWKVTAGFVQSPLLFYVACRVFPGSSGFLATGVNPTICPPNWLRESLFRNLQFFRRRLHVEHLCCCSWTKICQTCKNVGSGYMFSNLFAIGTELAMVGHHFSVANRLLTWTLNECAHSFWICSPCKPTESSLVPLFNVYL